MIRPSRCRIAVLALAASVLAGCSKKEEEPQPVVTVQTAVAQKTSIEEVISAEAVLFPRNQAAITPKVVAPVKQFMVNRGARVRKGQLLAVLENRDLSAAVEENKGAYEQAEASYKTTTAATLPEDMHKAELDVQSARESLDAQQKLYDSRQNLFKQGALPRKDLDQASVALVQAKAQYQLAEQHLAALKSVGNPQQMKSAAGQLTSARGKFQGAAAQLDYSEIRSPIDGVVTDRPSYPGETPAAGTPLITVMDTSSVIAKTHIPQDQAAQLKAGNAATISGPGDAKVDGKVALVSPALDPNSTTVEVWIEAMNPKGELRPGETVKVEAVARKVADAVVVPAASLLKSAEGGTTVMVVGPDGKAHQTEVEVGIRNGDQAQITKGLKGGEKVVTQGAYGLPDGTQVKEAQPPAPEKPSADKKDDKD